MGNDYPPSGSHEIELSPQDVALLLRLLRRSEREQERRSTRHQKQRAEGTRPPLPKGKQDWADADIQRAKIEHTHRLITRLEAMK